MADNIVAPGTGEVLAYDDVGGVKYERVKICAGANNEASDVDLGQQSAANSLPVVVASNQPAISMMDDGPAWTSNYKYTTSADAQAGIDISNAPGASNYLCVTDVLISVGTAMTVTLQEETSGTVVAKLYLPANGSIHITPRSEWKLPVTNKKLRLIASAAGNVAVTCWWYNKQQIID